MELDTSIDYGKCQCRCGEMASIAKITNTKHGHIKGKPVKYCVGHSTRRKDIPLCGYIIEDRGYKTPCWI
jgi:hypothetical protein